MKLEQIEQVLSLAKTGSFTETARLLYMSQPNLSQSIRQLEQEIGNAIFERSASGLVLTSFGREYLEYLQAVRDSMGNLENFCSQYPHSARHTLNIAVTGCSWVIDSYSKIILDSGENPLNFSFYNTETLQSAVQMLRSSTCDLAVVALTSQECRSVTKKLKNGGIDYHKLTDSPFHIMIGEKNPFYLSDVLPPIEEFSHFPYVNYGSGPELRNPALLRVLGLSTLVRSVIRVNSSSALYRIVAGSNAFTISANTLGTPPYPGIRSFPLGHIPYRIEFGWIKLHRTQLPEIAELFLDEAVRRIEEA